MDVPFHENGVWEDDLEEISGLGMGSATTLEMSQAQKAKAKKREATKVIGFCTDNSDPVMSEEPGG